MPQTLVRALASVLFLGLGVVSAQERRSSNDGKIAPPDDPIFKRFRVTTEQGTLVVYDANESWHGRENAAYQMA